MYAGIALVIISLIIILVRLPRWIKSGEINEFKDWRSWLVIGIVLLLLSPFIYLIVLALVI